MAKNYYLKPEVLRAHWDACVKAGECSNELIKDFRLIADNVYVVITKVSIIKMKKSVKYMPLLRLGRSGINLIHQKQRTSLPSLLR